MKKIYVLMLFAVFSLIMCCAFKNPSKAPNQQIQEEVQMIEYAEVEPIQSVIFHFNKDLNQDYVRSLANEILKLERQYDIDRTIILSIVALESRFNPFAKNPYSNASGLGQIIPRYWSNQFNFKKEDLFNWQFNLETTVKILYMMKQNWGYKKDWMTYYHSSENWRRQQYYRLFLAALARVKRILDDNNVGSGIS